MELTRRDVLAALGAAGVAVGGGAVALSVTESDSDGTLLTDETVETVVAVGNVLYPSAVENVESFVTEYVRTRGRDRPAFAENLTETVAYLDEYTDVWYGTPFAALSPEKREKALKRMGADTADPVPSGSNTEKLRYYLINELLFALYTTPTGGTLVGIENPQGHPGGATSYRRGPES